MFNPHEEFSLWGFFLPLPFFIHSVATEGRSQILNNFYLIETINPSTINILS